LAIIRRQLNFDAITPSADLEINTAGPPMAAKHRYDTGYGARRSIDNLNVVWPEEESGRTVRCSEENSIAYQ
jgi:hypothetical protein